MGSRSVLEANIFNPGSWLQRQQEALAAAAVKGSKDELILPHQYLGNKACTAISIHLYSFRGLRTLDLSANNISSEGLSQLLPAVRGLQHLQRLSLDWNPITTGFKRNLPFHLPALAGENLLPSFRCLCDTACCLKALELLSLAHCQLGPDTVDDLISVVEKNGKQLRKLNLRNNFLGEECTARLATALKANKHLTDLDITGNGARPSSLRQIANRCRDNRALLQQLPHEEHTLQDSHQNEQHRQKQHVQDCASKVEAELKTTEQRICKLQSAIVKCQLGALVAARLHVEHTISPAGIRSMVAANFMQDERRHLLKENALLKGSLEQRYQQLCKFRVAARQHRLQLQQQQQQQQQHKQQHMELQQQLEENQTAHEKLLNELQQELQREAQRRHQEEKEASKASQGLKAELEKANHQMEELQQRLHEQRETGQLQKQLQEQQDQCLAEARQEATVAAVELEELRANQCQLVARAAAAEAEQKRQRELLDKRQNALELLQQQLMEEQQSHMRATETLKDEAAAAAACAEERQHQLLQQLQQQRHQHEHQQKQLQAARAETAKHESSLRALREAHIQVRDELKKAQSECQRAQEEGRHAVAKLQRQQREWQQQREDLCIRLRGEVEHLHAILAAADAQETPL
ncbi:putative mediator of RNA polymerase II transcription subunit 26 [Cyclospora cayetanensis]|uniref:Mediator of RNA polymerase II transcription subunit 26 n=1 Tax=Cyclospora cayetanensis TaxID=88456 RepID=A0A6P6S029_9EIME|nr:putative mediator of RNA polymerase II transcription subunit 26 [Cyclospora cayetanensis]